MHFLELISDSGYFPVPVEEVDLKGDTNQASPK
jgi:hypothetical protein